MTSIHCIDFLIGCEGLGTGHASLDYRGALQSATFKKIFAQQIMCTPPQMIFQVGSIQSEGYLFHLFLGTKPPQKQSFQNRNQKPSQ